MSRRESLSGKNRPRKGKQEAKEFVFESGSIASSDRDTFSPGPVGDLYFANQEDLEFVIVPSRGLLK